MLMPDVNVLVYAHRQDERHHRYYRVWLEELANGREPFALSVLVAIAFVRIVTHPNFAARGTPLPQALTVIDALCAAPQCRLLEPGRRHWELTATLCRQAKAAGKMVGDAQHAAVALEHGCTWVTRDRDFRAFTDSGLRLKYLEPPA